MGALYVGLARMKYPAIMGADIAFTLTSPLANHIEVKKTDAPSGIGDHSRLLKLAGHLCNARAPYAHHLRKKILRKKKIRSSQIMHAQKPFACSRLNRVESVTSCRLLHLSQKELIVFHEQPAKGRDRIGGFSQRIR